MKYYIPLMLCLIFLLPVSCASADTDGEYEITQEEYGYAMLLAAHNAQNNALSRIYNSVINCQIDFIPEQLSAIKTKMNDVPGLSTLAKVWRDEISSVIMDNFETFRNYTDKLIMSGEYVELLPYAVYDTNTGATDTLIALYRDDIKKTIESVFHATSMNDLQKCITQYNTYIQIRAVIDNVVIPTGIHCSDAELMSALVDYVAELYFTSLAEAEELYRTTPDPYADETASRVFGLS